MILTNKEKNFFLNNGYLILKNILPKIYVDENINDAKQILLKNNYKLNSDISYNNSFLRLNFVKGELFNERKEYPKTIFKKIFNILDDIVYPNKYSFSGLDNRLFIGLKSKILENKKINSSYWHIDGWNSYHFLNVKENALTLLFSFCDLEDSGGTLVIPKSIKYITELLFHNPQGIHPDSLGGYSYIIPYILNKCSDNDIVQLKINKGDVVIMHPFLVHKACLNNSNITKIVNNNHIQLTESINLNRKDGNYSLLEESILSKIKELNLDIKNYKQTSIRKKVVPPPHRNNFQKNQELSSIINEMKLLKQKNIITPKWVNNKHNYLDNKTIDRDKIINKINMYNYVKRE